MRGMARRIRSRGSRDRGGGDFGDVDVSCRLAVRPGTVLAARQGATELGFPRSAELK